MFEKIPRTTKYLSGIALTVLGLLIAAYSNHFNNGFHFDDFHTIVNNVFIRDLKNIPAFFTNPKMFSSDPSHWGLRSLVTASLAVDYWLGGGLYAFNFQLSTFIWHIVLCAFLFFLYRRLMGTTFNQDRASYLAIAATAWYALHKANAETLNYIISRSDVLSTLMIVISLYVFIKWPTKRKFGLYIIPAFLGVFAKETMPVLVIILFFYILLFEKKLSIADVFRRQNFKAILQIFVQMLPLVIVVVITQLYTLSRISSIPGMSNPLLPYVLTQTFVWVHYFIAFFIPANLSADSDWKVIWNAFDERIIVGCIFVISLFIAIFRTSSKSETRPVAFGLIWFAASLLPTSLAPFAEVTNDHRMYFPFIGLALSVVSYTGILIKRYDITSKSKRAIPAIITVFVCVLLLNAYGITQRNKVWRNEETLWHDVTVQSPENGRGLMNYGVVLMQKHNYTMAGYYFNKAKQYNPEYNLLYLNIGVLDADVNKPVDADQNFQYAVYLDSTFFDAYNSYGNFLLSTGNVAKAKLMGEKALRLNPYSEKSMDMLMSIYDDLQLWGDLKKTAEHKLSLLPSDTQGLAYLKAANEHAGIIVPQNESTLINAADYLNLSLRYYNEGLYDKCIIACNETLKRNPHEADAWCNIGAAYNKLKQWDKATIASKKALEIRPGHELASNNLKYAESMMRN